MLLIFKLETTISTAFYQFRFTRVIEGSDRRTFFCGLSISIHKPIQRTYPEPRPILFKLNHKKSQNSQKVANFKLTYLVISIQLNKIGPALNSGFQILITNPRISPQDSYFIRVEKCLNALVNFFFQVDFHRYIVH